MRRCAIVLAVLAILAVPCVVMADGSSVAMGLGYERFDQKYNSTAYSGESGNLPLVYIAYEYKKDSGIYARLYGDYAGGQTEKQGSTTSGNPYFVPDRDDRMAKLEADFGYTFEPVNRLGITPYIGIGYRYWEAGSKTTPQVQLSRAVDTWFYVPIGVKADYRLNEKWTVGAIVTFTPNFGADRKSYPSEISPGANNTDVSLKNRAGHAIELPIKYRFTEKFSVVATPWYERTDLGGSDSYARINNGVVTGTSSTSSSYMRQYGIKLGAVYDF